MPEMHWRQPAFTYGACGPFTKNKERIKKFKETGDPEFIYQNELDKACFQHDMAYGDFKDLPSRATAYKVSSDKAFNTASNLKYNKYQRDLPSIVYKIFDEKTEYGTVKNKIMKNKELAEKLHKPVIRKFEKRKVFSSYIDIVWVTDLADMQ